MKRWSIPGKITGGECALVVKAETRAEAIAAFKNNEWEAEDGSWECEPNMVDTTDDESIDESMSDDGYEREI